ncbi:MAG: histidine phosphatase family protein [Spirochaetes bacterium]|nr:histidine phosphatase family protein [Spirochaetota bacterium]
MIELLLVRHGQADSAGDNYDQLTAIGYEQARRVGEWLVTHGYTFSRALHGGLQRQEQTLAAIREAYERHGAAFPEIATDAAFREFDIAIWNHLARRLRHGHAEFHALLKAWNVARRENAVNKGDIFKRLTGIILGEWVKLGDSFTEAESFPAFRARVLSAMEIHSHGASGALDAENHTTLAVTSGGPIALITGHALGLDLKRTLGLMRRIANTSIHRLLFERGEWDTVAFNMLPHMSKEAITLV